MNNPKPLYKQVFTICLGISFVLCSASLVMFSFAHLQQAQAAPKVEAPKPWDDQLRGGVGLGIADGKGYFVVWGKPNMFYSVDLAKAKDWYAE